MNKQLPIAVRFIALSNLVSYLSLVFAMASIYFASQANLHYMAAFWVASGVADCFDGKFANMFNRSRMQRQFGKELDTLVDLFSFGAAPVVGLIIIFNQQSDLPNAIMLYVAGTWYIFATIHRLGYFNITVDENNKISYGLPTTESALLLSLTLIFPNASDWSAITLIVLGILMLAPVRINQHNVSPTLFIILILIYLGVFLGHSILGTSLL
uniref:CDP-diacylglycerol---serine O-phosphatidyltransferase n=1 Tax=Candidatus Kentrum sp. TUN TaxID=2126343 RepID=A0A451AHT5_9GAMM|nr:MAG: CDP-diacylglycerol---serine O-phosphatidyltransferase [Candidatus Kentron sp. TUN]VFK62608.1 MAG: CDP-diacylglycerol---serine O-phosphatidyltransferase [Candidatus Kentron sp. TUN]VFK65611.1 MAG: CDP-diacylglycerol---serine O-phosphatidyltransferase [Candidatus Kentron sp. TUN]